MTSQPHDPKHTEGASVSETRPNPNSHVTVRQDPDNPDNVIIRTRKRKRTGRRHSSHKHGMSRRTKIILIVVGIIVGILAAAGIALAIAVHMGNVNLHQVIAGLNNTPEEAKVQDEGQVVEYKGHTYRYNENVVAIALIGHDDESSFASRPDASCADIDALIALDTATNKMRVIMVPRNSWVPVDVFNDDGTYAVTREMQLTLAHAMKQTDDNTGGWEGAELRTWLNEEAYGALGEEIAPYLQTADVHTNNVGQTTSIASVTSTLDRLWVPSVVEVCGPVAWRWDSDLEHSDQYNAVLNAEGSQYACFAGAVASSTQPNEALALGGSSGATQWWLRSSSASKPQHYRQVGEDGDPSRWGSAPQWLGVRFCFCL